MWTSEIFLSYSKFYNKQEHKGIHVYVYMKYFFCVEYEAGRAISLLSEISFIEKLS